ncbi:nephrin related [Clonorchis sinensis]|uniref:Nephrin related n=1 Tax=Clonorchis sinensis TaxID=79923 RepID=G7YDY0_CLOSI|nr:nephrin related [Clonorchis sinensis]
MSARLNKLHHGKLVECRATNLGYDEQALRPAFTKLEVHYAPVVSIQVRPPRRDNEYMEHDIITVECAAHGRPDSFMWDVTAALRGYKTKHGLIKDPFTVSTITRLIVKFESTGSVLDFSGKGRKSLSDERAPVVQNAVERLQSQSTMASSSITQVSQLTGILRASVHRIMRCHLYLYPYYFTLLQNITEEDKEQRVTFANWLLDNEEIVPNVLWSDEANFSVDGIIN